MVIDKTPVIKQLAEGNNIKCNICAEQSTTYKSCSPHRIGTCVNGRDTNSTIRPTKVGQLTPVVSRSANGTPVVSWSKNGTPVVSWSKNGTPVVNWRENGTPVADVFDNGHVCRVFWPEQLGAHIPAWIVCLLGAFLSKRSDDTEKQGHLVWISDQSASVKQLLFNVFLVQHPLQLLQ